MKTYIKALCDKYYVVTSKTHVEYKQTDHIFSLHDFILINAYFDILEIAEDISTKDFISPVEYMEGLIKFAKPYRCKIIKYDRDDSFRFPVFFSEEDANRFKSAVDARLLLIEMRDK